jgi:hypothetical protein
LAEAAVESILNWIITYVLPAVILFVIGYVAKSLKDYIVDVHPLRSYWKEFLKSGCVIVVPKPLTGEPEMLFGDTSAALSIHSFLQTLAKKERFELRWSDKIFRDDLNGNLVLIGGPMSNSITKAFTETLKLPFSFSSQPKHDIMDSKGGPIFSPKENGPDDYSPDYAIVLKIGNPHNEEKKLVIIAGCHRYGTYIGAKCVTLTRLLKKLEDKSVNVLEIPVIQGVPQMPTAITKINL